MLPTHRNEKPSNDLKVLCFTFRNLSPKSEFFVCCALVFLFYLIYGYFAELIFTLEGVSGWYITLVQFLFYTIFGVFENLNRERSVPLKIYFLLAFLTLGTMVIRNMTFQNDDVLTVSSCLGSLKLLIRIPQLSDANHLQKL
jgi:UAA transporter family